MTATKHKLLAESPDLHDDQVLRESLTAVIAATQALVADIEEHHSPDDCSTCRAVDAALDAISNAERKIKP